MADAAPVRALVVDDEPLAREGVVQLAREEADVQVVGECGTAAEALRAVASLAPDVLFLDIQLGHESGLDVVRHLRTEPPAAPPLVVFVTAYDEHAVTAFELYAVDYLLKPLDPHRFRDAVARVRRALAAARAEASRAEALSRAGAAADAIDGGAPAPGGYLERVAVRVRGKLLVLPVADVEWVAADGDYMRLHAGGRSYLLRTTMAQLERRLDPRRFMRVHRSALANVDAVRTAEPSEHGDYVLTLRDGSRVRLSRTHRDAVLSALGAS